jgi:molybdate transport system substrate-binding protein
MEKARQKPSRSQRTRLGIDPERQGRFAKRIKTACHYWALCSLSLIFGLPGMGKAADPNSITVFAAASTTNAVTEIGRLFGAESSLRFIPSFASSSTLAKQIGQGAPADVFISANKSWMDYLEKKGLIVSRTRFDILSNSIAVIAPLDSEIPQTRGSPSLDLLNRLQEEWLAMGDPDHVPAGMYARQALSSLGLWQTVEGRVARTKDVRAALALVERGEAPLGIVYATDAAITGNVKIVGVFPEESHPPIVYPMAIIAGRQSPIAEAFLDFLETEKARAVFEKYGFKVDR